MRVKRRVGVVVALGFCGVELFLHAQNARETAARLNSRMASGQPAEPARSPSYAAVQRRLAQGWNTWDVNSVATHVLLPSGLAIHVGLKHNTTVSGDAFLGEALIGRQAHGAEEVFPGPHAWDGAYTDLRIAWKGHSWRIQSARDGGDVVVLATPLESKPISVLPPTIVFSVNFLWNMPGTAMRKANFIETHGPSGEVPIYCTCEAAAGEKAAFIDVPVVGPYFAADLTAPVGVSTGKRRSLAEIDAVLERERAAYEKSIAADAPSGREAARPIADAIETTIGWDTIYEPAKHRVVTPITRVWSVDWGGYVLPDWDQFFAATLASIGSKDLAYANALEMIREATDKGLVPNYARSGEWKSFDRSEPPVGSITVLKIYKKFHERWFIEDAFGPLLVWNRWWAEHRDTQGYLAWGSDGDNAPGNPDDGTAGTRVGAILESGLDNSPMYDAAAYNPQTHVLEYGDVGLMSMYIADCDALAQMADALGKTADAKELRERSARYRTKLETMWDEQAGIFLNKDLHTGEWNRRLSPTNFYPMLAHVATPEQAKTMIEKHLLNSQEFWGEWVIPSIERDDPAFHDQDYWRGRIWGPMNYLVYLGLEQYDDAETRRQFARKSYQLFLKEWQEKGHVHENYNALLGEGDDVSSSDRFYHWGALLGYVEYLELTRDLKAGAPN
ncbi:MAG: trehalase family glycosidase [Terracidiphilus sp.]